MAATLGGCVEYVEHPRYYGKVLGSNPSVVSFLVQHYKLSIHNYLQFPKPSTTTNEGKDMIGNF
ncbi:hypothetical protein M422DRAFT_277327 [Sphaerobolus stellatus SS14]|uniref:Uncharacterized protein n=1 Tax=Sphaerobolus stellatus (strain SS14) TaxID=990650 RepID=A0A0C9T0R6_SPHS4|nr:hypothetical protein M422DRAFT_277327 [Sphaerobolus stellatus SS14]